MESGLTDHVWSIGELLSGLMRNGYLVLAILFVACCTCFATTVVVCITPSGIVIGADGKAVPSGTAVKIALVKNRFVVADIYTESAKSSTGELVYDFPTWMSRVEKNADAKLSIDDLTDLIQGQMTGAFTFASDAIKTGQMTKESAASSGVDVYLVQYVIAGYKRDGNPIVYSLTLMPDWNSKSLTGPHKVILHPEQRDDINSHIFWRGRGLALERLQIANSDQQQEMAKRVPVEFSLMRRSNTLTVKQASNVVRSLLAIEIKTEPEFDGFPITVVTIPRRGNGQIRRYERDVSPLSVLPKHKTGKAQKKSK